ILNINIGEGVAPSGSGNFSRAGIYAANTIGTITNQGAGSDIRGAIISGGTIGAVSLTNGSIIDSHIWILASGSDGAAIADIFWQAAREGVPRSILIPQGPTSPLSRKTFQIGAIGAGAGIIGGFIQAANIGPVTAGGFGVLGSFINGPF